MLQQTQVATVIAYYERWMSRFPDVQTLAAASEHDVLALWQGLGYYSRARNLHRAAKAVVEMHDGRIPDSLPALRALPGIGEYTAAAVAAFSWDHPVPVVDANIARVLARLTDWQDRIDTGSGREFLRETATLLQPKSSGGRLYNSAIMELGALVCRAGQPNCLLCPVQNYCTTSIPAALPLKSPRATTEFRNERVAFILEENHIYLKQSESARWRGLWHMPETPKTIATPEHSLNYPITKYKVRLDVVRGHRAETQDLKGFRIDEIDSIPMPAPHRRAIMAMLKKRPASNPGCLQ